MAAFQKNSIFYTDGWSLINSHVLQYIYKKIVVVRVLYYCPGSFKRSQSLTQ
jgi:hypothetical protein